MGWYTAKNNDKVNKLVLYAPLWLRPAGASLIESGDKLGAYRTVTRDKARARWLNGVVEDKKAALIPAGWFEMWADATFAPDSEGMKQDPPVLRAPNGILQDAREQWGTNKPLYDPGAIRVLTFLAHAEWDADLPSPMLYAYFEKLSNTPYKCYVQIGEGTHIVMMEKNRMQLFEAVQQFHGRLGTRSGRRQDARQAPQTNQKARMAIVAAKKSGATVSALARVHAVSRATITNILKQVSD